MSEIPAPALGRSPWWAGGGCFGRHKQKEKTVTTTTTTCSNVAGLVALCERVDSLWWREQTVGMCPRNEYILVGVTFILLDRRPCSYLCGREGSLVAIDLPTPTVATSILHIQTALRVSRSVAVSLIIGCYSSSTRRARRLHSFALFDKTGNFLLHESQNGTHTTPASLLEFAARIDYY
jgi:hypothetical protein